MSNRLSKEKWNLLDDLLDQHGFGGYYDLVECLKMVAGDLGISEIGIDLTDSFSLPEIVKLIMFWSRILSETEGFMSIVKVAAQDNKRR